MRDGAVVALEVVLDDHLPVRVVRIALCAKGELEPVDVDAALGEHERQLSEMLGERRRSSGRVDEHERPPGLDGHRHERQLGPVEADLPVGARRRAQRSVEVVGPRVVGALDRLAPLLPLAQNGAAVAAHVDEAVQLVVAPAREDDGHVTGLHRDHAAGLGHLRERPGVLPRVGEDPLLLDAEHGRIHVPVVRKRPCVGRGRHPLSLLADRAVRATPAGLCGERRCRVEPRQVRGSRRAQVRDERRLLRVARQQRLPALEVGGLVHVPAGDGRQAGLGHPAEERRPVEQLEPVDERAQAGVDREALRQARGSDAPCASGRGADAFRVFRGGCPRERMPPWRRVRLVMESGPCGRGADAFRVFRGGCPRERMPAWRRAAACHGVGALRPRSGRLQGVPRGVSAGADAPLAGKTGAPR